MKNTSYLVSVSRTTVYRIVVPGDAGQDQAISTLCGTPVEDREAVEDHVHSITAELEHVKNVGVVNTQPGGCEAVYG